MNAVAELPARDPSAPIPPPPVVEEAKDLELRPQPGPQHQFSNCDADIAVIGGGAFGGKTFSLLFEDTEHFHDSAFASVTFRRDTTQIRNPGGLWDEATLMYVPFGARPLSNSLEMYFPSGAVSKFAHLEHKDSVYAWDGAQIPLLKFDQLESFEESQFWYMLSRNRDPSGHIKPYCRATCNPDPDSWLKRLLAWWLDPLTGYAIPERSGKLRWFIRDGETMNWADTCEELMKQFGRADLPEDHPLQPRPMSITFILARIWDNKIGLGKDPAYLSKLKAQARHERERLLGDPDLGGNWNVRASAGTLFRREWCATLEVEPEDVEWVRGWDLAGTAPSALSPDPDWTVGVRLGKYRGRNRFVIAADVKRLRKAPAGVEDAILHTAQGDGKTPRIRIPQDPGQAGKAQAQSLVGMLAGWSVVSNPVTGDKVTRFSPFSAQAEHGNVDLVKGIPEEFLAGLEAFPAPDSRGHDDDADAVSEAFAAFQNSHLGFLEFAKAQYEKMVGENAAANAIGPGGKPVADMGVERAPKPAPSTFKFGPGAKPRAPAAQKKKDLTVAELDALRGNGASHVKPGEWPGG